MSKRSLIALAAGLIVLGAVPAAQAQYNYGWKGGFVKPCSLDGVNPAYHPDIFGNPEVARSYGFVRGRDGRWQVSPACGAMNRRPY
ncbi:MAG TPA: hypothetical protein VKW08_13465 [Xanthobacteraceae bacterium]|nr:hypothetical protein [Xanthobacteraceae bacterium]